MINDKFVRTYLSIICEDKNALINRLNKLHQRDKYFWVEKVLEDFEKKGLTNKEKEMCVHFFSYDPSESYCTQTTFTDKMLQALQLLKRDPNLSFQRWSNLDSFLRQHYIKVIENKARKKYKDPDDFPNVFSDKEVCQRGVVTYQVAQTKEALLTVRGFIDAQYGFDRNPWCLVNRCGEVTDDWIEQAWDYWTGYNSYHKRVAFQNGKIFAFCAHGSETFDKTHQIKWWDMEDLYRSYLVDMYDQRIKTKPPNKFTDDEYVQMFIEHRLKYNEQTKRYDCDYPYHTRINQQLIKDGHFAIPFGQFKGTFVCSNLDIVDLTNGPTKVGGGYDCSYCYKLQSLKGAPKQIGGNLELRECQNLINLEGCPEEIGGHLNLKGCKGLKNLNGIPSKVYGDLLFDQNVMKLPDYEQKIGWH